MDLKRYVQIASKRRLLLAVGLVLGLGLGAYTSWSQDTTYRGSVTFFVSTVGEGTASSANLGDQFAQRRVNTYLALLRTDRLAEMIVDDLGLQLTTGQVRRSIGGRADLNTVLLTATVTDVDRARVDAIAVSLSSQFVDLVADVETTTEGSPNVRLEVVSGPTTRQVPVSPTTLLLTRGMMGLILAAVIAFVLELLDTRLHTTDQLLALHDAPLLGTIAYDKRAATAPLVIGDDLMSTRAEAYRQLRTNLQFLDADRRAQVVVVTSSVPGEGKSTTAANLALAIANTGSKVLLIDADLRRPSLGGLFSIEQAVGLTNALVGQVELSEAMQPWGTSALTLLPSGTIPPNPSELLGSHHARRLIEQCRDQFDMVIVDSPPLLPVTDAAVLSTMADGVVVVVRFEKVKKGQLDSAVHLLQRVDARLLGFVASMVSGRGLEHYGQYHGDYRPASIPDQSASVRPDQIGNRIDAKRPADGAAPNGKRRMPMSARSRSRARR